MTSHFIPRNRVSTYSKQSVRTFAEVSTERQLALEDKAAKRHSLTRTAQHEREVFVRKMCAAIEAPRKVTHHIIRPRSVKPERKYNNA